MMSHERSSNAESEQTIVTASTTSRHTTDATPASDVRVGDIMSKPPRTLQRNDRLSVADDLMRAERIRHLPVLDERGLVAGIVTQRDLFHSALVQALGFGTTARDKMLESIVVKDVMRDEVVTTGSDTSVAAAAGVMSDRKIGCLPVVDGDTLVGILTEADLVRLVADGCP